METMLRWWKKSQIFKLERLLGNTYSILTFAMINSSFSNINLLFFCHAAKIVAINKIRASWVAFWFLPAFSYWVSNLLTQAFPFVSIIFCSILNPNFANLIRLLTEQPSEIESDDVHFYLLDTKKKKIFNDLHNT